MSVISLSFSGSQQPSSIKLLSLLREDTGSLVAFPAGGDFWAGANPGEWQIEFIDPQPGLSYQYTYQVHLPSGQDIELTGHLQGSGPPISVLLTYDEFIRRWGVTNVARATNKTTAVIPDFPTVQDAFNYAVDEIFDSQRGGPYLVPLDWTSNKGLVPPRVRKWASVIAYADLYDVRGWEDKDKTGNKISRQLREVYTSMALVRMGLRQIEAVRDPAVDAGIGVVSESDVRRYAHQHPGFGRRWLDGVVTCFC